MYLNKKVLRITFLLLIEFTYNNNFHSSIGMTPFETLYGRKCRMPLCWYESGEGFVIGPEIFQKDHSEDQSESKEDESFSESPKELS